MNISRLELSNILGVNLGIFRTCVLVGLCVLKTSSRGDLSTTAKGAPVVEAAVVLVHVSVYANSLNED